MTKKRPFPFLILILLTLFSLLGNTTPFRGISLGEDFAEDLKLRIAKVLLTAFKDGFDLVEPPIGGHLYQYGVDDTTLVLNSGVEYAFVAVCGYTCTDIDVFLYDENGRLVASDTETAKNFALLGTITPRRNGEKIRLRVKMIGCTSEPCSYGIVVLCVSTKRPCGLGLDTFFKNWIK